MNLEEKIAHWKSLQRDSPEFSQYYWQEIFPEALARFIEKSQNISRYRYMISTVGLSPEPIIFFLQAIKPEKALLIYTPDSEKHLDLIAQKSGLSLRQIEKRQVQSTDVIGVYKAIKEFVVDKPHSEVLIDATGGKKPMVGAATLAGNFLNIDVGYSDSTYLPDLKAPEPGTEFARILDNPLVVFADFEIQKAKEAINNLHFARAEEILTPLEYLVEDVWLIRTLKSISRSYARIDSFHFKEAEEEIHNFFSLKLRRNFPAAEKNLGFYLNILAILQNPSHELNHPYLSIHLLFSGFRFAKRGRYDVAVFLMYRVIEAILAALLKENYGLDPSSPDYSKVPKINKEIYHQKLKEVFEKPDLKELPSKIGLMDQAIFLNVLQDKATQFIDLKKLKGIIDLRNDSWFTHGFRALDEKDFNIIKRMARVLLESYLRAKNMGTVKDFEVYFEFPQIS